MEVSVIEFLKKYPMDDKAKKELGYNPNTNLNEILK